MNDDNLKAKKEALISNLTQYDAMLVAFSGGVDSTFLLAMAVRVIGAHVLAVTAESKVHPQREREDARRIAESLGVKHIVIKSSEMNLSDFTANSADRCYVCKKHVLGEIAEIGEKMGIKYMAHGANADDLDDYRPGLKAAEEAGVLAPLVVAGLRKDDIRQLSREMGLPTWNKPSMACLASRIPYGTPISPRALQMVEKAEDLLLSVGVRTCRVRYHGDIARIELDPADFPLILAENVRGKIMDKFRELGFVYVSLDLDGYMQGSLNKVIS